MLEGQHVFNALAELHIEVRSPFTHSITIPLFPNLNHLCFVMRGVPACILRRQLNRHQTSPVRYQIELPRLKHIVVNTDSIGKVLSGKLPSVTVLTMCCISMCSITEYETTLYCALAGTEALCHECVSWGLGPSMSTWSEMGLG